MTLALSPQALPFHTDFHIAGTRCLLSTNSRDLLWAATSWRPLPTQSVDTSFEMEIFVDSCNPTREHSAHFRGLHHLVFAVLPPNSFVAFDLLRRRVHAVFSPSAASDPRFWNTLFLPITIGVLGPAVGVAPLHCACLDRGGTGALIAGPSGAGKSTLAAAMAQRGFALVSDDWTYVSRQQSTLVAHGLSSPVKLLPDAVRFFPELARFNPVTALNGELAYEIDPRASFDFEVKAFSHPRHIFFLNRTSCPGCHIDSCRPEYVRDFFEKNAERLPEEIPDARTFRAGIIKTLSECTAWVLQTGDSPGETAQALEDFLWEIDHATA